MGVIRGKGWVTEAKLIFAHNCIMHMPILRLLESKCANRTEMAKIHNHLCPNCQELNDNLSSICIELKYQF